MFEVVNVGGRNSFERDASVRMHRVDYAVLKR